MWAEGSWWCGWLGTTYTHLFIEIQVYFFVVNLFFVVKELILR